MYNSAKYQQIEGTRRGTDQHSVHQTDNNYNLVEKELVFKGKSKRFLGEFLTDVTNEGQKSARDIKNLGNDPVVLIKVEDHDYSRREVKTKKEQEKAVISRYNKVITESEVSDSEPLNRKTVNAVSAEPRPRHKKEKVRESFVYKIYKDIDQPKTKKSDFNLELRNEDVLNVKVVEKPNLRLKFISKVDELDGTHSPKINIKKKKTNPFTNLGLLLSSEENRLGSSRTPAPDPEDPLTNLLSKGILGVDHHLDYKRFNYDYLKLT
jgi:hypothetical protein